MVLSSLLEVQRPRDKESEAVIFKESLWCYRECLYRKEKSIIPSPKKGSKDQYMKKDSLRSFHHFILVYHKLAKGVFLITMVFMFMVDASEYPVVSS